MKRITILFSLLFAFSSLNLSAQSEDDYGNLDLEALLNVRVNQMKMIGVHHTVPKGELLLSYSFGRMVMEGLKDGTDVISVDDVHKNYMVSPLDMITDMQYVSLVYGLTDRISLLGEFRYSSKSMDHERNNMAVMNGQDRNFIIETDGIADSRIGTLIRFEDFQSSLLILKLAVDLPIGSIEEANAGGKTVAFPMQLGSGTVDPIIGVSFLKNFENSWSFGLDAYNVFRLAENSKGYKLGNLFRSTFFVAKQWNPWLTNTLNLCPVVGGNIKGSDKTQEWMKNGSDSFMNPNADPGRRGFKYVKSALGFNFHPVSGFLKGQKFSFEFCQPLYEDLNGPQLKETRMLTFGWSTTIKSFK